MRASIRSTLALHLLIAVVTMAGTCVHAQALVPAPAPARAPAPGPSGTAVVPPRPSNLDEVVATVNDEKITRADLLNFLGRYQVQPLGPEQIYRDAMESLANTRLIAQFMNRQQMPVTAEKINEAIDRDLRAAGVDLQTALQQRGLTLDELRREYAEQMRVNEYVRLKGTDAELKRFAAGHKDLINGTQVKASHIFLKVSPEATPAEKGKIREKLVGIKQEIAAGKVTFAEAANKFSEDPANAEGSGGDIGFFGLKTGLIEEFSDAAFALKPAEISDPVETGHGLHLIQVTDRKEGTPADFEQRKGFILQMYAADLLRQIVAAERKEARIDIKPMPADLLSPTAASPAAATPAAKPDPAKPADASTPK